MYYSYGITTNSCINVIPYDNCGENNYTYTLYSCNEIDDVVSCSNLIVTHDRPNICLAQEDKPLPVCSSGDPVINTRYMCAITDGPDSPANDAYVEWHWYAKYSLISTGVDTFVTGKFIFVASAAYIASQHARHGYGGVSGKGIGMFNPSNNNP